MGDCIDLTLDSDEEAPPQNSRPAAAKRRLASSSSDDSDVVVVEEAAEAKRASQEPGEQQEPVDPDADVIVTGATGAVALRDYPHSRPDCGSKLFKKGVHAANSNTCPQCYCLVCDKNAAECQLWGTGVRPRDHCNAHSTSYWEALKKAARKGNNALLERDAVLNMQHLATLELPVKLVKGLTIAEVQRRLVPTGFYKGASGRTPEFGEHLCLDNIATSRYVPGKRKEKADVLRLLPLVPPGGLPAAPCSQRTWRVLVVPSDASAEPQAVAVTVEHNCTLKTLTAALRSKLGDSVQPNEKLVLALHSGIYDNWRWLRQDDMSMSDTMLINSSSHKDTYYAFRVPQHLLPQASEAATTYMGSSQHKTRLAIVWHEKTLPQEQPAEPQQQQQQQQQLEGRQQRRQQRRQARRSLLRMRGLGGDDEDSSGGMYGSGSMDLSDYDDDDDDDDDEEDMYGIYHRSMMMRDVAARRAPQGVQFGVPQLVVVPELHLHGGDAADKAVRKSIIAQLGLFCRPGAAPAGNDWPFELKRVSVKAWEASQNDSSRFARRSPVELSSQWESPGVGQLYAYWGTEPIAPPAGFDLEAFSAAPEVADAADKQLLAGMPKLLQEWTTYQAEMQLFSALPNQVIMELKSACNASPPPTDERNMQARAHKPAAAAVLSILPATPSSSSSSSAAAGSSSSAAAAAGACSAGSAVANAADAAAALRGKKSKQHSSGRLGVLRIEVYVFKTAGRGHRLVAEDANDWGVEISARQARRGFHASSCVLKSVMDARLLQEPNGATLLRELEGLKNTDCRSIAKLMQWAVTAERLPAQQPAGLNVRLHPYQLQSLAFMQEAEKLDGGWRQLLWRWLPLVPQQQQQQHMTGQQQQQVVSSVGERGQGVWWSPVLERLSHQVPPAPWGGFLAEEMGLGKTVEVLGLVLSYPLNAFF
ncbi:hypothetical protein OEZ86_005411 [Tetradesmus obliquus]|nr:hypothetical protein OEZ86_005411 [Tetradesmus obliquus]